MNERVNHLFIYFLPISFIELIYTPVLYAIWLIEVFYDSNCRMVYFWLSKILAYFLPLIGASLSSCSSLMSLRDPDANLVSAFNFKPLVFLFESLIASLYYWSSPLLYWSSSFLYWSSCCLWLNMVSSFYLRSLHIFLYSQRHYVLTTLVLGVCWNESVHAVGSRKAATPDPLEMLDCWNALEKLPNQSCSLIPLVFSIIIEGQFRQAGNLSINSS